MVWFNDLIDGQFRAWEQRRLKAAADTKQVLDKTPSGCEAKFRCIIGGVDADKIDGLVSELCRLGFECVVVDQSQVGAADT